MNTHTLVLYHAYLARVAALLAALCALSVFLYGIFLLMAVAHTAARSEAQSQIVHLSASLGDLEAQYLSQDRMITPEHAQELGYVKPQAISTVYATAAHSLTINANR